MLLLLLTASFLAPHASLSLLGIPVSAFDIPKQENATTINTSSQPIALLATVTNVTTQLALQNFTITWPTQNQSDATPHTFIGKVGTLPSSEYYMFWQVGSGVYTRLTPSQNNATEVNGQIHFSTWKWNGDGPYELSFIVQDRNGKELFRKKITVKRYTINGKTVMSLSGAAPLTVVTPLPTSTTPVLSPVVTPPASTTSILTPVPTTALPTSKIFSGKTLYRHPNSSTMQKQTFDAQGDARSSIIAVIANQPQAIWLTQGSDQDVQVVRDVMAKTTSSNLPVFVLYAIPNRDCNSYSAGGVGNGSAYLDWMKKITEAIGSKPTVVIFEPDALPQITCLSTTDQNTRLALMKESMRLLSAKSNIYTYLDIGHPFWLSVDVAVNRLKAAGVEYARGFSLNVSNYFTTADNIAYGEKISARLNAIPYVIDTSRNGNGAPLNREWCNPSGRALGAVPQFVTTHPRVDAHLWIKHPGESDGTCNGGPRAGAWWLEQALGYVRATQN